MAGEWIPVMALAELPEGKPIRAAADGSEVLLYRTGDRILAVSNRCTHQGAPLSRGSSGNPGRSSPSPAPSHGSTFQLADGRVMRGPATERLPVFESRVNDGTVELRPAP
jgi:nitrite reductase/ring-hydroxylating ferredoxin subunit